MRSPPPLLICTLGGSWGVVPEILGYLAPGQFPLYPPEWFSPLNRSPGLQFGEVICVTTAGVGDAWKHLRSYWDTLPVGSPSLRIYCLEGVTDIASREDNDRMEELICRIALRACREGRSLYWSLAGGRKTMSSLLQRAAGIFGAEGIYHVATSDWFDRQSREGGLDFFCRGIPGAMAKGVTIIPLGTSNPADWLDWTADHGVAPLDPADYPLSPAGKEPSAVVITPPYLVEAIREREQKAADITRGYFYQILSNDHRENFRALYRLPLSQIERLKQKRIGADPLKRHEDLAWLRQIPKADLHSHLGGALLPDEIGEVACAILEDAGRNIPPSIERCTGEILRTIPPLPSGDDRDIPVIQKIRKGIQRLDPTVRHFGTALFVTRLPPHGSSASHASKPSLPAGQRSGSTHIRAPVSSRGVQSSPLVPPSMPHARSSTGACSPTTSGIWRFAVPRQTMPSLHTPRGTFSRSYVTPSSMPESVTGMAAGSS